MAFTNEKNTNVVVYLTELGREKMLNQGFAPSTFSIADGEANYFKPFTTESYLSDVTGDNDDNVYSMNKNVKLETKIIR